MFWRIDVRTARNQTGTRLTRSAKVWNNRKFTTPWNHFAMEVSWSWPIRTAQVNDEDFLPKNHIDFSEAHIARGFWWIPHQGHPELCDDSVPKTSTWKLVKETFWWGGSIWNALLPEGRRMNSLCRACWSTWSSTGGHHSSNWNQTQQSFFSGASCDSFPDSQSWINFLVKNLRMAFCFALSFLYQLHRAMLPIGADTFHRVKLFFPKEGIHHTNREGLQRRMPYPNYLF